MDDDHVMEVDPWSVVVRHGKWYLLCWSHSRDARRVLRVDRIRTVEVIGDRTVPAPDLEAAEVVEEHLAHGWSYEIEVVIDAPADAVARWIPRTLGRPEPIDADTTRLLGSTDEPDWYAGQLTAIRSSFRVVRPDELRKAVAALADRLAASL